MLSGVTKKTILKKRHHTTFLVRYRVQFPRKIIINTPKYLWNIILVIQFSIFFIFIFRIHIGVREGYIVVETNNNEFSQLNY